MALKTARFDSVAEVAVDESLCNGCGACAKNCSGAPLRMQGKRVRIDQTSVFGCIGCGQCMAVCPEGAIHVSGRDISDADLLPYPDNSATFDALHALLLTRRSVRHFTPREVEPDVIERVLQAASTAPMGLPPSDVRVLVFNGRTAVKAFRDDLFAVFRTWKWMTTGWGSALIRPFIGKATSAVMHDFIGTVIDTFEKKDREGVDAFFYDAPAALYFHASALADPADPIVAATHAMIAAQSLGLGTTMLGIPGIVIKETPRLKRQYGVDPEAGAGLALILGYRAVHYHHALRRRFGEVRWYNGDQTVKPSAS